MSNRQLFQDIDGEALEPDSLREASDRQLLAAIWLRREVGDLAVDELWGELVRRYPAEPRLLLLLAYHQVEAPPIPGVERVEPFLLKLERLLGKGLDAELAALIATADGASMWEGSRGHVARLTALRGTLPSAPSDVEDAYGVLEDFEQRVIHELHHVTRGDQPILPASAPAAAAEATGPIIDYAPTRRFQVGERIRHPRFGVGVVTLVGEGKLTATFGAETRTLVAG
ncbi:MAG TPA: hypothetical protein VEQ58_11795 [Polyangiaceae bacterium]|nr:hypothetical protein [Polyangiaceae bacterium]